MFATSVGSAGGWRLGTGAERFDTEHIRAGCARRRVSYASAIGPAALLVWLNGHVTRWRIHCLSEPEGSRSFAGRASLDGNWTLKFRPNWAAPAEAAPFFKSWTDFDQSGIRYFSGTATYDRPVNLTKAGLHAGAALDLDLADARARTREGSDKPKGELLELARFADRESAIRLLV